MSDYADLSGRPIKVGSLVVYAALWSRSAVLKYGRVAELTQRTEPDWRTGQPIATIKVVTVDRQWHGGWELQNRGRPVTLAFLDRIVVVEAKAIAAGALALLKAAE